MKAKLPKLNQRLDGRLRQRNIHTLNLCRRPDAKSEALGPYTPLAMQTVAQGKVEGIQLNARMKAGRKLLHDAFPHKRLGPVRHDADNDAQHSQAAK